MKRTIATGFEVLYFRRLLLSAIINCVSDGLSSLPSRSHSGSGVDASDDADAVDWSCCLCVVVDIAVDVDVEVVDRDVAVVEVLWSM